MSSPLSHANKTIEEFTKIITLWINQEVIQPVEIEGEKQYIIFLSIGNKHIRSIVLKQKSNSVQRIFSTFKDELIDLVRFKHIDPTWLKVDIVKNIEALTFPQLEEKVKNSRKNYFRHGISFDSSFRLSFLEQEVNGNVFIRERAKGEFYLDEVNINNYLKKQDQGRSLFIKSQYTNKTVYIFETKSLFKDRNEDIIHELYNGPLTNGIRKVKNIKDEVEKLITYSTYYLTSLMKETGQFTYGYFSAFAKKINTYNILRHSSSLYSMVEGYEIVKDKEILEKVELGLQYLIDTSIVYKDKNNRIAYVVDHANEKEIKLGSNATAILAMAKYMEVTKSKRYLELARALARGIIDMKLPDGGFIHVLHYPSFEIKELYRIIYYEGEAVFALLRLYAIDQDKKWLKEVKQTFDYFIENDYWQYHDHWLSYAANELTTYEPEDKYFIFGLKNSNHRLRFIYDRETTFPTFLELTMATYKMIEQIKKLKKDYLLQHIDETFLVKTIDRRAEYQRVGFFYPELAMYKKSPILIKDGFFIRHHSFRVRIDDVEHYLSGYCQYYLYRIPHMENYDITLEDV